MFSCAFESVALGMAYLIPFDYTLMVTSGLFIKLRLFLMLINNILFEIYNNTIFIFNSSLPIYISWVKNLSWLMYSNEAMSIIQWEGITNISN